MSEVDHGDTEYETRKTHLIGEMAVYLVDRIRHTCSNNDTVKTPSTIGKAPSNIVQMLWFVVSAMMSLK